MKPDRRTLVIAAAIIAGAVFLSARQRQLPACAGGSCCPLPLTFNVPTSNSFPVLTATNAMPVQATTESFTNRNP